MGKNNNLSDFLQDLSRTINEKKGYPINKTTNPQDFSNEVETIVTPNLHEKTVSPSTEQQEVTPTSPYNGLSKVTVKGMKLQTKTVSPSTSGKVVAPDDGYDALAAVGVSGISPTKSAQTYTPKTTDQVIPSGRWLIGAQTIKGDARLIPSNIRKGISIFDVLGTFEGDTTVTWYQVSVGAGEILHLVPNNDKILMAFAVNTYENDLGQGTLYVDINCVEYGGSYTKSFAGGYLDNLFVYIGNGNMLAYKFGNYDANIDDDSISRDTSFSITSVVIRSDNDSSYIANFIIVELNKWW